MNLMTNTVRGAIRRLSAMSKDDLQDIAIALNGGYGAAKRNDAIQDLTAVLKWVKECDGQ